MSRFDQSTIPRMVLALSAIFHAGCLVVLAIIKAPPLVGDKLPQYTEVAQLDLSTEPVTELKLAPSSQAAAQLQTSPQTVPEARPLIKAEPKRVDKPKPKARPVSPRPMAMQKLPPAGGHLSSDLAENLSSPGIQTDRNGAVGGQTRGGSSGVGDANGSSTQDAPYVAASYRSAALHNPPTSYPPLALTQGLEGTVKLRVQVLTNGSPGDIHIQQSSGHAILDNSAVTQLRKWRFIPARKGNQPVESFVIVPISFKLRH